MLESLRILRGGPRSYEEIARIFVLVLSSLREQTTRDLHFKLKGSRQRNGSSLER